MNLHLALPDVGAASGVGASYQSGTLDLIGQATQFTNAGGTVFTITPAQITPSNGEESYNFEILASLDSSGNIQPGTNDLVVDGSIGALGDGSPLLTGNLMEFGSSAGLYEFIFITTGGSLAADYGGIGSEFGVIARNESFPATLNSSFAFTPLNGTADIESLQAVPEPGSILLFLSGFSLLAVKRRRVRF